MRPLRLGAAVVELVLRLLAELVGLPLGLAQLRLGLAPQRLGLAAQPLRGGAGLGRDRGGLAPGRGARLLADVLGCVVGRRDDRLDLVGGDVGARGKVLFIERIPSASRQKYRTYYFGLGRRLT